MINITRNEEVVLNQIKIYDIEYPDGVPVNILRKELGFHEYDLVHILEELQDRVWLFLRIIRQTYLKVKRRLIQSILKKIWKSWNWTKRKRIHIN